MKKEEQIKYNKLKVRAGKLSARLRKSKLESQLRIQQVCILQNIIVDKEEVIEHDNEFMVILNSFLETTSDSRDKYFKNWIRSKRIIKFLIIAIIALIIELIALSIYFYSLLN